VGGAYYEILSVACAVLTNYSEGRGKKYFVVMKEDGVRYLSRTDQFILLFCFTFEFLSHSQRAKLSTYSMVKLFTLLDAPIPDGQLNLSVSRCLLSITDSDLSIESFTDPGAIKSIVRLLSSMTISETTENLLWIIANITKVCIRFMLLINFLLFNTL
jgi:hypothetical protein